MHQNEELTTGCIEYRIQEKDSLFDILRRFDISICDLKKTNEDCDLFALKQGQIIYIKNPPDKKGYVLKQNETLMSIAEKLNISIISLLKANPNYLPQEIKQGTRIVLPE